MPAIWLIHLSGRTLRETFSFGHWRRWLIWGGGVGLLIALTGFIPKALACQPLLPTQLSFALMNVLIIAPIFEELLIRGAVLGNLQRRFSFWVANALASVMFVVLHMPGLYFMGSLAENMTKPIGGVAVSIAILGMRPYTEPLRCGWHDRALSEQSGVAALSVRCSPICHLRDQVLT